MPATGPDSRFPVRQQHCSGCLHNRQHCCLINETWPIENVSSPLRVDDNGLIIEMATVATITQEAADGIRILRKHGRPNGDHRWAIISVPAMRTASSTAVFPRSLGLVLSVSTRGVEGRGAGENPKSMESPTPLESPEPDLAESCPPGTPAARASELQQGKHEDM